MWTDAEPAHAGPLPLSLVRRAPKAPSPSVQYLCINQGRAHVAVPRQLLDRSNIVAVFQQMCRERMPRMASSEFCKSRAKRRLPHRLLQHRFGQVMSALSSGARMDVEPSCLEYCPSRLEKAAGPCRRFEDRNTTGFAVAELQADEIRSIVGGKQQPIRDSLPSA